LEKDYITGKGLQKDRARARDLICYWCAVDFSLPMADLAKRFNITPAAVSYAVKRGEKFGLRILDPKEFLTEIGVIS
jgi:hypothetical protein